MRREKREKWPNTIGIGKLRENVVHSYVSKIVKVVWKNACKMTDRETKKRKKRGKEKPCGKYEEAEQS